MSITILNVWHLSEGDHETIAVDFTNLLDAAETLASVDAPDELTTSDLTITDPRINTATYEDAHRRDSQGEPVVVATAKAVLFDVTGQLAATARYAVTIVATTSTGRILARTIQFDVS